MHLQSQALPKTFLIEIVGFAVDQPIRRDVASTSWHRLQNDFITHSDFFDLEAEQRLLWPYLLGLASDKICPVVNVSLALASALMKSKPEVMYAALQHFAEKNRVRFVSQDEARAIVEDYDRKRAGLPPKEEKPQPDPEPQARNSAELPEEKTRNESGTDTLRPRDESVPSTAHNGTERNGTESKSSPLKPPRKREGHNPGSKRSSRRELKRIAVELVARTVRCIRDGTGEDGALQALGPPGMAALCEKYASWDGFCAAYDRSYRRGDATSFEAQLRDTLIVVLPKVLEARRATAPPLSIVRAAR
jgi:hypothetical protein